MGEKGVVTTMKTTKERGVVTTKKTTKERGGVTTMKTTKERGVVTTMKTTQAQEGGSILGFPIMLDLARRNKGQHGFVKSVNAMILKLFPIIPIMKKLQNKI